MIGHVKLVSYDKGYGFIIVRNQPHEIYFKTTDVDAGPVLPVGDQGEVEAYRSAPGKLTASKVLLQQKRRIEREQRLDRQRPVLARILPFATDRNRPSHQGAVFFPMSTGSASATRCDF